MASFLETFRCGDEDSSCVRLILEVVSDARRFMSEVGLIGTACFVVCTVNGTGDETEESVDVFRFANLRARIYKSNENGT